MFVPYFLFFLIREKISIRLKYKLKYPYNSYNIYIYICARLIGYVSNAILDLLFFYVSEYFIHQTKMAIISIGRKIL